MNDRVGNERELVSGELRAPAEIDVLAEGRVLAEAAELVEHRLAEPEGPAASVRQKPETVLEAVGLAA